MSIFSKKKQEIAKKQVVQDLPDDLPQDNWEEENAPAEGVDLSEENEESTSQELERLQKQVEILDNEIKLRKIAVEKAKPVVKEEPKEREAAEEPGITEYIENHELRLRNIESALWRLKSI